MSVSRRMMTCVRRSLLVWAVLASGSVAWTQQAGERQDLFADMQFRRGFLLSYADSSKGRAVEAVLHLGDANNVPAWRLCQWASKYSLAAAPCTEGTTGDRFYENEGKKVLVGGSDSPNRDLILEVRGGAEYGDRARRFGEGWPHLLIEQDAVVVRPLDELDEIRFSLGLRLLRFSMPACPRTSTIRGCTRPKFQMFFIVKNISPDSPDRRQLLLVRRAVFRQPP